MYKNLTRNDIVHFLLSKMLRNHPVANFIPTLALTINLHATQDMHIVLHFPSIQVTPKLFLSSVNSILT